MPESPISSKPLEPEKMLEGLQCALGIVRERYERCKMHAEGYAREAKLLKVGGNKRKAEEFTVKAKEYEDDRQAVQGFMDALEQAINALTVLNHPGFRGIDKCDYAPDGHPPIEPFTVTVAPWFPDTYCDEWTGTTPFEAVLKAFADLPPSTPLPNGKEDTHV